VARRVAEHKVRTVAATNGAQANGDGRHAASARAAEAAARVAARYAKAPSYSEMLADEARAAVRAAEAASKAALEAQAAAESVLAGLEAASSPTPDWEADFSRPLFPSLQGRWPWSLFALLCRPRKLPCRHRRSRSLKYAGTPTCRCANRELRLPAHRVGQTSLRLRERTRGSPRP